MQNNTIKKHLKKLKKINYEHIFYITITYILQIRRW